MMIHTKNISHPLTTLACSFMLGALLFPTTVFAATPPAVSYSGFPGALYVPVNDDQLNGNFITYANDFHTFAVNFDDVLSNNTDSLKNIISGGDPGLVAKEKCMQGDALKAKNLFPYTDGPWAAAFASTTNIPDSVVSGGGIGTPPTTLVQVNTSGSIRCILQDMVGWQKLQIYLQTHALLKQYISDAQQKQLSNQLLDKLSAASQSWQKVGIQTNYNGTEFTEPVMVSNLNSTTYFNNSRTLDHIVQQAAADPGNVIGSLQSCYPTQVAAQVARTNKDSVVDPFDNTTARTACTSDNATLGTFANRGDIDEYMLNPNSDVGLGAIAMLTQSASNPQNFPMGAQSVVEAEAARRIAEAEKNLDTQLKTSGTRGTTICSGLSEDPNCLPNLQTTVTSANTNAANLEYAYVRNTYEQLNNPIGVDSGAASSTEGATTLAMTAPGGALGYDPTGLATHDTSINQLVEEFQNAIQTAYFDMDAMRADWASGAMLAIYDELGFSQEGPTVAIGSDTGMTIYDY